MKKLHKKITAKEFDEKFDKGEDMGDYLNTDKATVHKEIQRINIDFPQFLLGKIDREARRVGVARAALIKIWIAERLGYA